MTALPITTEAIPRGLDRLFEARLVQLTSEPMTTINIYCEEQYCSADGTRIPLLRGPYHGERQLWVADLPTQRLTMIERSVSFGVTSALGSDELYFTTRRDAGPPVLHRVNLKTLERQELFALQSGAARIDGMISVHPHQTCVVTACHLKGVRYGLMRFDLKTGRGELIHERDEMCNSHHQFEPGDGRRIMVQLNRGCEATDDGQIIKLAGGPGATLYLLDTQTGQVTDLPVGGPHDGGVTGHECWVPGAGSIILTLYRKDQLRTEIHRVAAGDKASTCLARGPVFMHISASADGRFWIADDLKNSLIYVGSIRTGRMLPLCDSGASFGRPQASHPHAYMTPDNRHVVFNSDRTGVTQVWAAQVPDEFLDWLDWQ